MYTIRDVYKFTGESKSGKAEQRMLVEALAQDEELLNILTNMLEQVKVRQRN